MAKAKEEPKPAESKFKPLRLTDQAKEQRETVGFIQDNWQNHPWVNLYFGLWREWMAWYDGDQYTWFNKHSQELFDLAPIMERETKNVYNRILPMVRQQWAEIRYDHSYYVEPSTTEPEDIRAAKISSYVIEHLKSKYFFGSKVNQAKLWALIVGTFFWKVWWNKNNHGYVLEKNRAVKAPGDIDYMYVIPFNCRPDPLGRDRSEWRYFTEGKVVPLTAISEEFKIPLDQLRSESIEGFEDTLFISEDEKTSKEPRLVRKEHWTIPTEEYPKGRFIVTAGDWLCYDGPNPTPGGAIPYFKQIGVLPKLGESVGDSSVRIGQAGQRRLNRYCSMVDEHIENFRIKALIPQGSLVGGELTAYKRVGMDYIIYNSRAGQPYFQQPPAVPETVIGWIRFQENEMETETSVRKVSLGELPKYAQRASGVLFQGLKNQDTAVLVPGLEEMDLTFAQAWSLILEIVQDNYTEERLIKIVGRNKEASVKYVKGADIKGATDVRVKSGIDVFANRQKKEEVVAVMLEKGVITDPKQAFDILEMRSAEDYMEDEFIDERQARRQLEIMKTKDIYIEPQEDDNHEVMFRIFNDFRKMEEFETIPKKCQENIKRRITAEKEYAAPKEKAATPQPTAETLSPEEQAAQDQMKEAAGGGGIPAPGAPAMEGLPPELAGIPPEILQVILTQIAGGATPAAGGY